MSLKNKKLDTLKYLAYFRKLHFLPFIRKIISDYSLIPYNPNKLKPMILNKNILFEYKKEKIFLFLLY